MADAKSEPTEFQRRLLHTVMTRGLNQSMNLTELAIRMKSNRVAVHSAIRSLESKGLALTFRSDSSQWAVLKVAPTNEWRRRVAAEATAGNETPATTPTKEGPSA